MYNSNDISLVGKHDYDEISAEKFASWNGKSFSVNIFRWVLKKDGKSLKQSKGIVRVHGSPLIRDRVFEMCKNIVKDLDNGEWDGRKNVIIK